MEGIEVIDHGDSATSLGCQGGEDRLDPPNQNPEERFSPP